MIKFIYILALFSIIWPTIAFSHDKRTYQIKELEEIIINASKLNNVPHKLLLGICRVESNLNPHAFNEDDNNSGSYGLCQLKVATIKALGYTGERRELFKPDVNAYWSAKLFRYHYDKYNDWDKAIIAYNAGIYRKQNIERNSYLQKVKRVIKLYYE